MAPLLASMLLHSLFESNNSDAGNDTSTAAAVCAHYAPQSTPSQISTLYTSHHTPYTPHRHHKYNKYTLRQQQHLSVYLCIELKWRVMALSRTRHTHTQLHVPHIENICGLFHFCCVAVDQCHYRRPSRFSAPLLI